MRLNAEQVVQQLQNMTGWEWIGNAIRKEFVFRDFTQSVAFVNRMVEPANTMDHHPDVDIRYNRVQVTLTTHDEGGVTEKDLQLAKELDALS
ncbi:4a-hydroxytetrahydrobiopterin dehydratase [Sulfobacillus thermosulfidooxidans]|uniref:4a-hydroxytetrahydrobiopterin dehydratase n=1 Tax=Sulfobacillus thermosulfidooxidans TaxID=28034 RepID=UPI0006B695FB|nr:4a-hydroxytetrahydrobiopterin dehydratase [Sulfobacillus thermosulfidooxidans]